MRQLSLFEHALKPLSARVLRGIEAHLSKHDWFVAPVDIASARRIVQEEHYAGGASNTAVYLHGLYNHGDYHVPYGVAWWLPPIRAAAVWANEEQPERVLALHRLAIRPEVPTNGASFLIGRALRQMKREGRFATWLTYADEAQGHRGTIYRASNWLYRGKPRAVPLWQDAEGRQVSPKRGPRTLSRAEMREAGYHMVGRFRKHRFVIKEAA